MTLLLGVITKPACCLWGSPSSMGFICGILFLGVGFVFFSPNLFDAASMLQDVLTCSLGACDLTRHITGTYWVSIVCWKAPCSPGGSSYWAEAHVALGPGDEGLPSSLYHRAPQRLGRKCGLGAHGISGDRDMTRGARILTRDRGPNPLSKDKEGHLKLLRGLVLPDLDKHLWWCHVNIWIRKWFLMSIFCI